MPELTPEEIERIKSRDRNFALFDLSMEMQQELRESKVINFIVSHLKADTDSAIEELADIDPGDRAAVSAIQARIFRLVYFKRCMEFAARQGESARQTIVAEDHVRMNENDE